MSGSGVYSSPACRLEQEDGPMVRILRVPPALDKFIQPLEGHFHWNYFCTSAS